MSRKKEVEQWYKANANKIKKWANKRNLQDAEDILQDTAVRLLTEKTSWENISRQKVTRWTMYEYYKGQPQFIEIEDEPSEEEITQVVYNNRCIEVINECVEVLNGASKEIFKMHFFQDMGYEEIAEKLNMGHKSVKSLGSRSKLLLVKKFKEIIND